MKNNSGLTILETLMSLLVLSLGVLGLAPLIMLSVDSNNISKIEISSNQPHVEPAFSTGEYGTNPFTDEPEFGDSRSVSSGDVTIGQGFYFVDVLDSLADSTLANPAGNSAENGIMADSCSSDSGTIAATQSGW